MPTPEQDKDKDTQKKQDRSAKKQDTSATSSAKTDELDEAALDQVAGGGTTGPRFPLI